MNGVSLKIVMLQLLEMESRGVDLRSLRFKQNFDVMDVIDEDGKRVGWLNTTGIGGVGGVEMRKEEGK